MVNSVVIQGRLVADTEVRATSTGLIVSNFTLASELTKDKVYYIDCVAWDKTAEFIKKYFSKGDMLIAEGYISTRNWQADDGKNRKSTEIVVKNVNFCGKKADTSSNDGFVDASADAEDLPF